MQLNLEKNNFYKITNISSVKSKLSKITDLVIDESNIKGSIDVSLYYYDLAGKESFELISLPFELDLASLDVKEVKLIKANVFVVEGNGINIEYELEIEYELIEDKKETIIEVIDDIRPEEKINDEEILFEDDNLNDIEDDESDISIKNNSSEIEMITDVEIEDFEEDLEEVKEDTKEYYEEILEKNLRDNVEVITTKSNMDSESFLTFFDDNITYYRLKCVHVESEKELEDISKKYNIKIDELLSGYDKDTKKVIFKIE